MCTASSRSRAVATLANGQYSPRVMPISSPFLRLRPNMSRKRSWLMKRICALPVLVQTRFCRRVVIQGPRNMSSQKPNTRTGSTQKNWPNWAPRMPKRPKVRTIASTTSTSAATTSRNGLAASR